MAVCNQSVASGTGLGYLRRLGQRPPQAVAEHSPVLVSQDPGRTFMSMSAAKLSCRGGEPEGLLAFTYASTQRKRCTV